jgi:carbonic anhydrase
LQLLHTHPAPYARAHQVGDKKYDFKSMQLHSSAQHTLGGGASDAELELLHTNAADAADVLIIAVQLQAQATDMADNTVMAAVLSKLTGTTFADVAELASPYGACVYLQCCLMCTCVCAAVLD